MGGFASTQQRPAAEAHTFANQGTWEVNGSEACLGKMYMGSEYLPGGMRGQRVPAGFVQGRRSGAFASDKRALEGHLPNKALWKGSV